jgi:Raf kinase inhibitor-like YbhB/YbcL family protein
MTHRPGRSPITVTSPAFEAGGAIPDTFTCRGAGDVPPLAWTGVPAGADSLALVVHDPDAPRGPFLHWVVVGIPASATGMAELPAGAAEGLNSAGRHGWYPPCPPHGTHRYVFTVYALGARVDPGSSEPLLAQIEHRATASGALTGTVSAR